MQWWGDGTPVQRPGLIFAPGWALLDADWAKKYQRWKWLDAAQKRQKNSSKGWIICIGPRSAEEFFSIFGLLAHKLAKALKSWKETSWKGWIPKSKSNGSLNLINLLKIFSRNLCNIDIYVLLNKHESSFCLQIFRRNALQLAQILALRTRMFLPLSQLNIEVKL